MEKFTKEKEMEVLLSKNIAKMERKVYLKYSKAALKSSMTQIKRINSANRKFDKFNIKFKGDLKVVRSKLKLIGIQLKILNKKEKFLLGEIYSLNENKRINKIQMGIKRREVERLKKILGG